ncbi:MAG: glycyl-radical enzyme activating protein [Bacteroidota bacterium]
MTGGLIFDIRRFSVHDGPGIRTTIFFKGCPLGCLWCHNPESRDTGVEYSVKHLMLDGRRFDREETTGKLMTPAEVMAEIVKDRIFYEESGGGVTFSGGEPMLQETFLEEVMNQCKNQGIHTALDTSGYASPDVMARIAPLADLILFDLKIINDRLHRQYTGESNISILKNLRFLVKSGKNIIIRFPVIPGITDTPGNISDMKSFITDELGGKAPFLSLLPYHSLAREKYKRFCKPNHLAGLPDLKPEDLLPLKQEFEAMGMTVTIGG